MHCRSGMGRPDRKGREVNEHEITPLGRTHLGFGRYEDRFRIEAQPGVDTDMPVTPFLQPGNLFEGIDGKVYKILTSTLAMDLANGDVRYRHVFLASEYIEESGNGLGYVDC